MRKLLVILTTIIAFVACIREDIPIDSPTTSYEGEVTVDLSITIPEMQDTRSFASPGITSLHLLIFDEDGYLIQVCNAESVSGFGVAKDTEYKYIVNLNQSPYKRTIHLIANSPQQDISEYGLGDHERYVIDELYTQNGNEAYWARVDLPEGITGTYVKEDNTITFNPSESLNTALTRVPMVRNYTRVVLKSSPNNFTSAEIKLVNVPDRGSVAAPISDGVYAQFATREGTKNTEVGYYSNLTAQGYNGFEPEGTTYSSTDWGSVHNFYERHQQTGGKEVSTPAYAIVRGKYRQNNTTDNNYSYFKIDLCYTNQKTGGSELFNLLRNIEYNIVIKSVSGRGYSSEEEAKKNVASNNVSFAIEIKSLTNISDGTERLSVEYVQRVITQSEATVTLKYKYETNITNGTTNNGAVTFSNLEGNVLAVNNPNGATEAAKYIVSNVAGSDGWNTVTFKTQPISGTKTQTIILTAGDLSRGVEFIQGTPYTMQIDFPDTIEKGVGKSVKATFTLPKGLPHGMFPMIFNLVIEKCSLSPDVSKNGAHTLPVTTGLNQYGEPVPNGNYYGFEIAVMADEYEAEGGNQREYWFKTAYEDSSSTVNVYNQYFYVASDSFVAQ